MEKSKKFISDYNTKQGKSAIRPYYYNLGAKYGLSQSDIDNALKFDDTTGEVIFGGKNMGKPASISSDGVSYWDTNTLDNSFNDYISRTGTSRSKDKYVNQENDNWSNKLNELWGMNINDRDKITDETAKNNQVTRDETIANGAIDRATMDFLERAFIMIKKEDTLAHDGDKSPTLYVRNDQSQSSSNEIISQEEEKIKDAATINNVKKSKDTGSDAATWVREGKGNKTKSLHDIISYISDTFNIPISKGNLTSNRVKGEFKTLPKTIRLKIANDRAGLYN